MGIDTNAFNEPENKVTVEVVTLSGTKSYEVTEGMTVAEFKRQNGLDGFKIIDEDSNLMRDTDVINSDIQFFVSKPKQNG